jgi:branched-chain amino acid transport system permease protein
VVAAISAAAVGAIVMQRVVFHPLRRASFITLLISSFALSVLIQNILRAVFSPRQQGIALPDLLNESLKIGGYTVAWLELITLACCVIALVALVFFLKRSTQGLGMLAAAQDFDVTRLMGIPSKRVIGIAFAISGALAGLAAIFLVARRGTVEPAMGFAPLLSAFIAVVIGGLGSLSGAVVGGFVLAAIEVTLAASLPESVVPFRDAFALGIVIVILYFRPEGLLTRVEEAR